jgi:uncharacterized protein (DUF2236 family)
LRDSDGFFGPGSYVWKVDREVAVLLAGGARALMLQVAHPSVAAAVAEHSRFRTDPLGRLLHTLQASYAFAFDDRTRASNVIREVNRRHARVQGAGYSALDPHLLMWVYATLIDSSLLAYERFVGQLSEAERNGYYLEGKAAGSVWGIPPSAFPATLTDMRAWMDDLVASGEVAVGEQGRAIGRTILQPPLWWVPAPTTLPLALVTLWLLPASIREGFGYTWGPRRERMSRACAAFSRRVVPRLPALLRDLPQARAAERRVSRRGLA